ncbi:MAG TPA: RdgB/HAM1 family non-canonical purine NTP pyrophosphatase [Solirubrobacteraceae bacterium]|jgi:XTP/dITP diphosphohydrolase|nr:RdgB/HAM1 family non-canonical purine NTP pyrophosphatase [Solirubrobacteraceae bacterium]
MSSLVLATRNAHKLREMQRLFETMGFEVEALPDGIQLPPEHGNTFADNALPKALAAAGATGRPAIADDSGIEAAALSGGPGVRSARYAGDGATDEENLAKFFEEVPSDSRLRYVCALAYVNPSTGEERVFFGDCRGRMARERAGSNGFGYDPVFVPDATGDNRTMAELSDAEKDAISHRGHAVRALLRWIRL